jgi:hypothetical protein
MPKPNRNQPSHTQPKKTTANAGVVWYTEENWGQIKALATDPERFEATYAEWHEIVTVAIANLQKAGVNAVKCFVSPDELMAWCLLCGKPNNAASRAEFVSQKMNQLANAASRNSG